MAIYSSQHQPRYDEGETTHPSINFFIDRSDLYGSSDKQNAMSRHCLSSVASLYLWHNFSTIDSACLSYLISGLPNAIPE
jgi:hypothetical protein